MKTWYELWSKAGASPNYRVETVDVYLSGLNWVSNWVQNHFFNKISDYMLSLFLIVIICYIFLTNFKKATYPKKASRYANGNFTGNAGCFESRKADR